MTECWKRAYQSATAAWASVGKLPARRRAGNHLKVERRDYRCPFCRRWHLTSEASRRERHERHSR